MTSSSFLTRSRSIVRRKDRQLTERDWQDRMLATAPVGHLAISWHNEPFLHSNLFWYDGEAVYLHQARVGKLRAIVDEGPLPACFTVSEMGRILPNYTPLEFSVEYASVLCYGQLKIATSLEEQRYALEGMMEKYSPQLQAGRDYDPMPDSDIRQTTVHRLLIAEMVGKHNIKPLDYLPDKIAPYALPGDSFIDAERNAGRASVAPKELA